MRNLSGKEAMEIMIESLGEVLTPHQLTLLEYRVRGQMAKDHPVGGNFKMWLNAMAQVIVDAGDEKADVGFQRGVRRIRELAAKR